MRATFTLCVLIYYKKLNTALEELYSIVTFLLKIPMTYLEKMYEKK